MGIFDSILSSSSDKTSTRAGSASDTLSTSSSIPNPFLKAMNQDKVQDLGLITSGRLGSLLRKHGRTSGDTASIIDATLDFFLGGNSTGPGDIPEQLAQYQYTNNFIPIILKTEFNYISSNGDAAKKPLYIVFDSTPDNITFAKGANWNAKNMLGRPEPVFTYQDSSATTVTITGDFFVNSEQEHIHKLKLSDYIMALTTPSRDRYMPSPIQVIIGEWKNFRAVVTNVSVEFKGPWKIQADTVSRETLQNNLAEAQAQKSALSGFSNAYSDAAADSASSSAAAALIADDNRIPQHAPYFFTATLTLSLVSKDNEVNYAEDIIGAAGSLNEISSEDITNIQNQYTTEYYNAGQISGQIVSGAYVVDHTSDGYVYNNGVLTAQTTYTTQTNQNYAYENGDQDRMNGDLAVVTNAVSTQLSKFISKKLSSNSLFK